MVKIGTPLTGVGEGGARLREASREGALSSEKNRIFEEPIDTTTLCLL